MSRSEGSIDRRGCPRGRKNGRAQLVAACILAFATSGCVEHSLREGREPMDYEPVEAAPVSAASPGSVWTGTTQAASFMFFDEKARRVGDLVTVVILERTQAAGDATTGANSERKLSSTLSSDVGFQKIITAPVKGLLRLLGFDQPGTSVDEGTPVNFIEAGMKNEFNGKGSTSRNGKFTGVVTCRVVGVLPNGILHIRGRRSVVVNHEAQYISLEGLVRQEDLTIENQVTSNEVAEMRLAYDGLGVLDDKQRPGWMSRVLDWIYPF